MAGRGRIVGSNLGSISYENGDGPATAEVRHARYSCDAGHVTDVPFSAEAPTCRPSGTARPACARRLLTGSPRTSATRP